MKRLATIFVLLAISPGASAQSKNTKSVGYFFAPALDQLDAVMGAAPSPGVMMVAAPR
jgi:hypothetical protein